MKFGLVDMGSDCGTQCHGFESTLRWKFKVSRLNNWRYWPFFSRAHKSVNFNILTNFFLLKFINQSYLKIGHNSKQIDFLAKYTNDYKFITYIILIISSESCHDMPISHAEEQPWPALPETRVVKFMPYINRPNLGKRVIQFQSIFLLREQSSEV